jgi:rod shape-determining protein MreD
MALLIGYFMIIFSESISVMGITPMLLVILVIWISFAESRLTATLMAFIIGFMFDVLSSDIWGTNAFAKTITAFIASTIVMYSTREGRFYTRFKFLLVTIIGTFIHNIIYFFFRITPSTIDFYDFVIEKGMYYTGYTAVFALIALLIKPPSNVESD